MKTLYRFIGTVVFWLIVLGFLQFIDFRLCVGPVGSCKAPDTSVRSV
ncbi:MAG: hypothetical protein PHU77_00650 [Simplicispira sp.]|nr:hypothetical protein [Simplicispira sp.]